MPSWTNYFREISITDIPTRIKLSERPRSVPPRTLRLLHRKIEKNPLTTSKDFKKKELKVSDTMVHKYMYHGFEYKQCMAYKKLL